MTEEQLKAEIRTALNLGSLSKGLGEDFPYAARFEGICKEYAAALVAEIEKLLDSVCWIVDENGMAAPPKVQAGRATQAIGELYAEIDRLKAENERMREGIAETIEYMDYDPDPTGPIATQRLLGLLSPAPEKPDEKPAREQLTKQCRFSLAWIGSCKKPCGESGFCDQHEGVKCCMCGKQATQECPQTFQFVCGFPICDTCKHH